MAAELATNPLTSAPIPGVAGPPTPTPTSPTPTLQARYESQSLEVEKIRLQRLPGN